MSQRQLTGFRPNPEGYLQHWLTTGLFAGLLMPKEMPGEGEATAGEPWHISFARFRRVMVPGYRGQEGSWALAVCALRSTGGTLDTRLRVEAEDGAMVGVQRREFQPAGDGPIPLRLESVPLLITLAIPARSHAQTFSAQLLDADPEKVEVVHRLDTTQPLRLGRVKGRDIWVDDRGRPCPTIWIELLNVSPRPCTDLRFHLATGDVDYALAYRTTLEPRTAQLLEIPYPDEVEATRANIIVQGRGATLQAEVQLSRTANDWEVHLVPHFHYDPVWWNTQANYVERDPRSAFRLIEKYLDAAARDPEFTFALEQVPYTKPYWDTFPDRREALAELVRRGQCEVVGALYNEPQTTLIGPEANVRAVTYGTLYHRRQWGAGRMDAWMLDVFGHDPNFPQMLARAGHRTVAYARGPYKRCWGLAADRLGYPLEHWWLAPDGSRVLARLLEPESYTLGQSLKRYDNPGEAWWETAELFERAGRYTAAHVEMWPVGGDFAEPVDWLPELARQWNERHLSPKIHCSTPAGFFESLGQALAGRAARIPALTRDLDPVNNGCDISYMDTKVASRLIERLLADGEALATVAALAAGRPYPAADLDLGWRQLLFGAHHDALTGSESDQVYVDLLGGWREAYDAASRALADAAAGLGGAGASTDAPTAPKRPDAPSPVAADGGARLTVFNLLAWRRDEVVEAELPKDEPLKVALVRDDETGEALPAEVTEVGGRRLLRFVARDLPALGARTYSAAASPAPDAAGDAASGAPDLDAGARGDADLACGDNWIENEHYRVEVDPALGGGIVSLVDKQSGRELVQAGRAANDLVAHPEYPELPGYGEGPWHVATTGEQHLASAEYPAEVAVERTAARVGLVARSAHFGCRRVSRIDLWAGLARVDFETQLYDYEGQDCLFKVHFPLAIEGGQPLYEVAGPVVSRTFCPGDQDTAEFPWTQDNAAYHYVDLTVPLVIEATVGIGGDVLGRLGVGMAEIVCPADTPMAEDSDVSQLLLALSSLGVTATVTWPAYRRSGDLAWDSNVPDFRVVVGGPEANELTRQVLTAAGAAVESELRDWVDKHGWAIALLPRLELGLPVELPVVLVWGKNRQVDGEACEHIAAQARHLRKVRCLVPAALRETVPHGEPAEAGAAIINRGNVSYCCYPDQTLTMSLMRSCTGRPSGLWIDGPRRTAPDDSGFQLEHWAHAWRYALVSHEGHWKESGLWRRGYEVNHPPVAVWGGAARAAAAESHGGKGARGLTRGADVLAVEPASVTCLSVRPAGTAVGLPLDEETSRLVAVRLQECAGEAAEARVRCLWPVTGAWKADLLEAQEHELTVDGGEVVVPLGQFETATVLLDLAGPAGRVSDGQTPAEEPGETAAGSTAGSAVYARWWRQNRGAAPLGFVPAVAIFGAPAPLRASPGETMGVKLTMAACYMSREAPVRLTVEAPEGWQVSGELPAGQETALRPGDCEARDLSLTVPENAPAGQYLVTARLSPPFGPDVYDVLQVAVGEEPGGVVEASIKPASVRIGAAPTGNQAVRVKVRNLARSPILADVSLIAPVEAWDIIDQPARQVRIDAGGEATVEYRLARPARELSGWVWALAKVAAAGQILYTETVRLDLS